jgi:hypothetical protein
MRVPVTTTCSIGEGGWVVGVEVSGAAGAACGAAGCAGGVDCARAVPESPTAIAMSDPPVNARARTRPQ